MARPNSAGNTECVGVHVQQVRRTMLRHVESMVAILRDTTQETWGEEVLGVEGSILFFLLLQYYNFLLQQPLFITPCVSLPLPSLTRSLLRSPIEPLASLLPFQVFVYIVYRINTGNLC